MLPFSPRISYAIGIRAHVHIPTPICRDISSCSRVNISQLPFIIQSLVLAENGGVTKTRRFGLGFPSYYSLLSLHDCKSSFQISCSFIHFFQQFLSLLFPRPIVLVDIRLVSIDTRIAKIYKALLTLVL